MRRKPIITVMLLAFILASPALYAQSTYTVNSDGGDSDANPGDGICATAYGVCTFRAAIEESNLDGHASTINFSQQMDISYPNLPEITDDQTIIDGSQQWNTTENWPGVYVGQASFTGILVIRADKCVVKGIMFGGSTPGIELYGGYNVIGGDGEHERNVFITEVGVDGSWGEGEHNTIKNNYFGTRNGLSVVMPGKYGINIFYGVGHFEITGNLIVGQTGGAGIMVGSSSYNTIKNNTIGANRLRNEGLPNKIGIYIDRGSENVIENNFICGNQSHGIQLKHAQDTTIEDNDIGWDWYKNLENGGDGVRVWLGGSAIIRNNLIRGNAENGIYIDTDDNLVESNLVTNSGKDGILVDGGQNNTIGGTADDEGNTIENNEENGIHITGSRSSGNKVEGNFIGGQYWDHGNQENGILLDEGANKNTIGSGNWINWNRNSGINLTGEGTTDNTVIGNVIGASNHWGWEAPNSWYGIGLFSGANRNIIGILGQGNTILASGYSGLAIAISHENQIILNRIGTDGESHHWGNQYHGIHIYYGMDNTLVMNEVAYNGANDSRAGVRIEGSSAVRNDLTLNSIHDNYGKGIELVDGSNDNLAAPVLNFATTNRVEGVACKDCVVEIFSDREDEGRLYEGSTRANAQTGIFAFSGTLKGPKVTGIARSLKNTSEFSTPVRVPRTLPHFLLLD
jgi:parallel beta-helix repeat protein